MNVPINGINNHDNLPPSLARRIISELQTLPQIEHRHQNRKDQGEIHLSARQLEEIILDIVLEDKTVTPRLTRLQGPLLCWHRYP
jgi:hypothetical protein